MITTDANFDADTWVSMMRGLSPVAKYAIQLYRRCKMFNELEMPEFGGVLDQDERTIQILEAVHNGLGRIHSDKMAEATRRNTNKPNSIENFSMGKSYSKSRRS